MKISYLKHLLISILSLVMVFVYAVSPAVANQYSCEKIPVVSISAPDETMVDFVCKAADKAIRFLETYELRPKKEIVIEITNKMTYLDGYCHPLQR